MLALKSLDKFKTERITSRTSVPVKWCAIPSKLELPVLSEMTSNTSPSKIFWALSSISRNWGFTPASRGNRLRIEAQNECIVWIFRPPGASMARAKSVRARLTSSTFMLCSMPNSWSSLKSVSFSNIVQRPKRWKRRFCISDAAAFV